MGKVCLPFAPVLAWFEGAQACDVSFRHWLQASILLSAYVKMGIASEGEQSLLVELAGATSIAKLTARAFVMPKLGRVREGVTCLLLVSVPESRLKSAKISFVSWPVTSESSSLDTSAESPIAGKALPAEVHVCCSMLFTSFKTLVLLVQ